MSDHRLLVCGHSGVGIYNFENKKWSKLSNMRYSKSNCRPVLCYDSYKQRVYSYINSSEDMSIYYFDLLQNEWYLHSQILHKHNSKNNLFWIDNDGVMRIHINEGESWEDDFGTVYEYDSFRNQWIVNKNIRQLLQNEKYERLSYVFM